MNVRLPWAFFKRDAKIAVSYRASFAVQLLGNVLVLGILYYMGKTIGARPIPAIEKYGGNFVAFLLVGIALSDCVGVSLTTFANQIREGQLTGTLEATLMSPVRLPTILIYSSLWNYFFSAIRFVLYLLVGAVFYRVQMAQANIVSALIIFVLTVFCFMGLGMIWASAVMIVKRGESIITTISYLVLLVSGVLFPVAVMPQWLRSLAWLIPLTHSLEGMRLALLQGYSAAMLAGILWKLVAFAVLLLTAGMVTFTLAVDLAKRRGSLVQY